jgi:cytochrome b561
MPENAAVFTAPRSRYSTVAIWLHWIIALLVIGNLAGGLLLDTFLENPDPAMKQLGHTIIDLHKSSGLTILLLTLVRIGWRLANPPPPLPAYLTRAEVVLSRFVHLAFYALLLLIPLSGWAVASTGKSLSPIVYFGLFEVPLLPLSQGLGRLSRQSHELLAYAAIGLLVLHIGAALKHYFLDRDNLLARMWPASRRG